ncbi:hypothetical protein H8959_020023 [Pygathrix nigripes]
MAVAVAAMLAAPMAAAVMAVVAPVMSTISPLFLARSPRASGILLSPPNHPSARETSGNKAKRTLKNPAYAMHLFFLLQLLLLLGHQPPPSVQSHLPAPGFPVVGTTHDSGMV